MLTSLQNHSLSDDTDPVLALQGVSWWTRQALKFATVTLHIKQYATVEEIATSSASPTDSPTEAPPLEEISTIKTMSKQPEQLTHIDIEQTATGGISGSPENRVLDWVQRERDDKVFGKGRGMSRWATLEQVDDDFLKEGWLDGDAECAGPEGQKHVESFVDAERGWTARQMWGFAQVQGKRYHVRRVVVIKGEQVKKVRLVYDFLSKEV